MQHHHCCGGGGGSRGGGGGGILVGGSQIKRKRRRPLPANARVTFAPNPPRRNPHSSRKRHKEPEATEAKKERTVNFLGLKQGFLIFFLIIQWLAASSAIITVSGHDCAKASTTQASQLTGPAQIEREESIKLSSLLCHQKAIERQCREFEAKQMAQLKQVAQDERRAHLLPNPLLLKVPAVCVFLFGPPGARQAADESGGRRLEMVNWFYPTDKSTVGPYTVHHSQATNSSSHLLRERRATAQAASPPKEATKPNDLFNELVYDLNQVQAEMINGRQEEQADEEALVRNNEVHKQMEGLLENPAYRQALASGRAKYQAYLSPVVLIPGLLGSRLQARTHKEHRVNVFCSRDSDWQDVWLSVRMFLPLAVDCWLDNARLEYDPTSGFARSPPGVETRVPDFGSVESVRHLDLRSPKISKYMSALIDHYQLLGYQPQENLFAAPYDFRLAPQQLDTPQTGYFAQLRALIERAHARVEQLGPGPPTEPNRQRVTLVCHSMGCTHALIFLRKQSAAWRQRHVRKLIAFSSPWAGTIKALKALLVGDQLELPLVSETKMRRLARTFPSIAYLLPQAEIFEAPNKYSVAPGGPVLVQTPERAYKVGQLGQLMESLNLSLQYKWFEKTGASLINPLEPLADLDVDCIHSLNVPTPETILYRQEKDFPNGAYELVQGNGDGTVNHQSLLVCAQWAAMLPKKVRHKVIMNINHLGVLSHPQTLAHITQDVLLKDGTVGGGLMDAGDEPMGGFMA